MKYLLCYKIKGWDYSLKKDYTNINSMIYECNVFDENEMNLAIDKVKEYEKSEYDLSDIWIQNCNILMFSKL